MKKVTAGRPKVLNKRESVTVRLKPELKEWLNSHNTSAGKVIELLIKEEIQRAENSGLQHSFGILLELDKDK